MTMRIAFRTDASLEIGTGHVMRCLTLADALRAQGAQCHFICREHLGHLMEVIRQRGYVVNCLNATTHKAQETCKNSVGLTQELHPDLLHQSDFAVWLGCTWQTDAQDTADVLFSLQPDWLVVDHYALDQHWEVALAPHFRHLLVIDDLADRHHHCNLLLDQNLGRDPQDYEALVPTHCQVLAGPQYALLRHEFVELRPYSLQRHQVQRALCRLMITMGGVDQSNATEQVLQALKTCSLPPECRITVIMGFAAPWQEEIRELAAQMPWSTEVLVNVDDMARRMADSDLVIGAAGSTSLESCCLGLPTVMVVLADNQKLGARSLEAARAASLIGELNDISTQLPIAVVDLIDSDRQLSMSLAASDITDGRGVEKVLHAMGMINV